jgi:hypothetical protein
LIYFAQPVAGGPIKIGCSGNVEARLGQLEAHYGCRLSLLATMPGDRRTEAEIHARFAHLRFGRTEQFRPEADLMAFIGRPLLVGANPDAVEAMAGRTVGRRTVLTIKGTDEWKAWLDALADHLRTPASTIVDHSLVRYAKEVGFTKPPPKR